MITAATMTREHLEALQRYAFAHRDADLQDWGDMRDLYGMCSTALDPIIHHWIPMPRDEAAREVCAQRFNELRIDWCELHFWTQSW